MEKRKGWIDIKHAKAFVTIKQYYIFSLVTIEHLQTKAFDCIKH